MLITKLTTVSALSRPPMVPLNIAITYLLSSTKKNPFQANAKVIGTANPSQRLYQPHTAIIDPTASVPSSSSVLFVNPINASPVKTQHFSVSFVAMNKPVKTFDKFHHRNTLEKF